MAKVKKEDMRGRTFPFKEEHREAFKTIKEQQNLAESAFMYAAYCRKTHVDQLWKLFRDLYPEFDDYDTTLKWDTFEIIVTNKRQKPYGGIE